ncbi:DUF4266 domain-containing protein [Flagellatimonas centrodinii]|uniref:DUF4266 domain-containing protein n=1 Tax=Flagellatimonas centrodinii TaxID=2806210 RepID=UPI001FFC3D9F|nr:DUF4266 domain-containing protein [Flagellatimonas centrodinii]ULQ46399.1 DUF4266 domain-containing protein [Flagellatimonas centrodinii]
MNRLLTPPLLMSIALMVTACAPVQPWQRGTLARPDMQLVSDPTQAAFEDHTYFSKEASSGGRGFGGGGCGCN